MHAAHYSRPWGFGQFLESTVASNAAEFTGQLGHPRNQAWAAIRDSRIVGSIAIDGEDLGDNQAHLRWFILEEGCRGGGVSRRLLGEAMTFCYQACFAATRLWTLKGLDAAHGFELVQEATGTQSGAEAIEQPFSRRGPG